MLARQDVHRNPLILKGWPAERILGLAILRRGPSLSWIKGPGVVSATLDPTEFWFPDQDSDLDLADCKPRVLPLDYRGNLEPIPRAAAFSFVGIEAAALSIILVPSASASRVGTRTLLTIYLSPCCLGPIIVALSGGSS